MWGKSNGYGWRMEAYYTVDDPSLPKIEKKYDLNKLGGRMAYRGDYFGYRQEHPEEGGKITVKEKIATFFSALFGTKNEMGDTMGDMRARVSKADAAAFGVSKWLKHTYSLDVKKDDPGTIRAGIKSIAKDLGAGDPDSGGKSDSTNRVSSSSGPISGAKKKPPSDSEYFPWESDSDDESSEDSSSYE